MTLYALTTVATDWIEIGSEKMRVARLKRRLSADEMSARMRQNGYKVTGRTYVRWEERGEVPRPALEALAAILGLDHGQLLADQPTRVQWQQVGAALEQVVATQKILIRLLGEQRKVVGELGSLVVDLSSLSEKLDRVAAVIERREAAN